MLLFEISWWITSIWILDSVTLCDLLNQYSIKFILMNIVFMKKEVFDESIANVVVA